MIIPRVPILFKGDAWYQNNFFKTKRGNALNQQYPILWAKVKDVRSYVTGVLRDSRGNVIQVEQTGYRGNPWKNVVKFELYKMEYSHDKTGKVIGKVVPFETGTYTVTIQGDRGSGDAQRITDEFILI